MRTDGCSSHLGGGGLCLGVSVQGVFVQGEGYLSRGGVSVQGDLCLGVSIWGPWGRSLSRGVFVLGRLPWTEWLTHASKTLPSLVVSNNLLLFQCQIYEILPPDENKVRDLCQAKDSRPIKRAYLRNEQLHISANGHEVASLYQAHGKNFVSLFIHLLDHLQYLTLKEACNFEGINTYTFQLFSTNWHEVISFCDAHKSFIPFESNL